MDLSDRIGVSLAIRATGVDDFASGWSVVDTLDLGLDATSVRSATDLWKNRTNSINETGLHWAVGIVNGGLDDIVGVRVAEQTLQLCWGEQLFDEHISAGILCTAQAFLNNVGAELLLGELRDLALELANKRLGEAWVIEVENVLNHVVSEWVLNQSEGVVRDHANEPSLLLARCMVNAALQHAATMTVGTDINAAVSDGIKDELSILRGQLVEALLDDVISVQILDKIDDLVAKRINDDLDLLRGGDELNHLLQSSRSVLVQGDADQLWCSILDKNGTLLIVAELEKLLTEVVAEWIGHKFDDVLVGLLPDHMDVVWVALLQLLLKEAATVLVLTQCVDLTTEGLESSVCESVHNCRNNVSE